jgi:hypothetical protein
LDLGLGYDQREVYNRKTATFTLQEMSAFMAAATKRQETVASVTFHHLQLSINGMGDSW